MSIDHSLILVDNQSTTKTITTNLKLGRFKAISWPKDSRIGEFSNQEIEKYIDLECRLDQRVLTAPGSQLLKTKSSGERKKALLGYLSKLSLDVLVVVDPFDSLDIATQEALKNQFIELSKQIQIVQISNRAGDAFPFIQKFFSYHNEFLQELTRAELKRKAEGTSFVFSKNIPTPLAPIHYSSEVLVSCKNLSVKYHNKPVLNGINWTIRKGEFWQLSGPNGSGKSTLLNLISGDNPKGYGQDLKVFGHQKGSGESVWQLKEWIGYFSPSMVDQFKGYHTLENMLISGLHDSVGLYNLPTVTEKRKATEWLELLGLAPKKRMYFKDMSLGNKRLLMSARAMIKHPPLLILDEPTVGLDDTSAAILVDLINRFSQNSETAVVYVTHRKEMGLKPKKHLELTPSFKGSNGIIYE